MKGAHADVSRAAYRKFGVSRALFARDVGGKLRLERNLRDALIPVAGEVIVLER
jgi:hypothetical protein